MDQREILLEQLMRTFPQVVPPSPVAPHDCLECSEIRLQLDGCSWREIPHSYIEDHEDILPLLSVPAHHAFLAAWLRAVLLQPDGHASGILFSHLSLQPPSDLFNKSQIQAVLAVAEWLCQKSAYGPDQVALDSLAKVQALWLPAAA
jgi:hypothetical protein